MRYYGCVAPNLNPNGICMKESDLYLPLKRFLESQNYEVKGEVENCEVVAVRGTESPVNLYLFLLLPVP